MFLPVGAMMSGPAPAPGLLLVRATRTAMRATLLPVGEMSSCDKQAARYRHRRFKERLVRHRQTQSHQRQSRCSGRQRPDSATTSPTRNKRQRAGGDREQQDQGMKPLPRIEVLRQRRQQRNSQR